MVAMRRVVVLLAAALWAGGCAGEEVPQGSWRLLDDGTDLPQGNFWRFCGELTITDSDASLVATVPYPFSITNPDVFWDVTLDGSAIANDGFVELTWTCMAATPSPKGLGGDPERAEEVCQFFDGWWIRCIVEEEGLSCPSDFLIGEAGDATCEDWQVTP